MKTDKEAARATLSLPGELWRPVDGFDGQYEVSNLGRVLSWKRWHGGPPPPRLMRVGATGTIQLGLHGGTHRVPQLVAAAFSVRGATVDEKEGAP